MPSVTLVALPGCTAARVRFPPASGHGARSLQLGHDGAVSALAAPPPQVVVGAILEKKSGRRRLVAVLQAADQPHARLPSTPVAALEETGAALKRAVLEKTGCTAELEQIVDVSDVTRGGTHSVTIYWRLRFMSESERKPELKWLPPHEAVERVSAPEKAVLERAFPGGSKASEREPDDERRARHRLDGLRNELASLSARAGESWFPAAVRSLDSAARDLERGDTFGFWAHALAAQRHLLFSLDAPALEQRRQILLAEAQEKLSGWRRDAVKKLLTPPKDGAVPVACVVEAAAIRDEAGQNEHAKTAMLKDQVGTIALVLVALSMMLVWFNPLKAIVDKQHAPIDVPGLNLTGLVFLIGLLGGAISAVVPLKDSQAKRLPQLARDWQFQLLRPTVGGASALAICLLLGSGILTLPPATNMMLAAALAAGISERFLTGAVAQFLGGKDSEAKPQ